MDINKNKFSPNSFNTDGFYAATDNDAAGFATNQANAMSEEFAKWLADEEAAVAKIKGASPRYSEIQITQQIEAEKQRVAIERQRIALKKQQQEEYERQVAIREAAALKLQMQIEAETLKKREEEQKRQQAFAMQQELMHQQFLKEQAARLAEQERIRKEMFAKQQEAQELARKAMLFAEEQERLRKQQEEILRKQQQEMQRIEEEQRLLMQQEIERKRRELQLLEQQEQQQQKIKAEEEEIQKLRAQVMEALSREDALHEKTKQRGKKVHTHLSSTPTLSKFKLKDLFVPNSFSFGLAPKRAVMPFAVVLLIIVFGIGSISFAQRGIFLREKLLGVSKDGYTNLAQAADNIGTQNFEGSREDFAKAYENFAKAQAELETYGGPFIEATKYIPALSQLSSGKNAAQAGKHISAAGQSMSIVIQELSAIKNPIDQNGDVSLLALFNKIQTHIATAQSELLLAQESIDRVNIDDLPKDKQQVFLQLKQKLPQVLEVFDVFLENTSIFNELLGGNGPRKYLFLFQNNTEMRATGGFIGSYGILDIYQGRVRNFFIDGIFNPDGQLREKIVPPLPIQKISVAWSLHDSNWFPDFPTSAQKAIHFYEKTGGPTADGVIAITPVVMQKLLRITGPIEMPQYDVTLDADNFIEKTQYEVEVDYDKEENKPKKILADLAPLVLDKLFSAKDGETIAKTLSVLGEGLQEKQLLLYSQDERIQKKISQQGWSGEVLSSQKDYISVINTNINGYKTDGVIDETIEHKTEVGEDGSLVNTVSITRKHNGGKTEYEWWNKVNANYMRVYVPKGSTLINVEGQTREINTAPVAYDELNFRRDELVRQEENSTIIDTASGTRIYEENGKTVFANWTYVSPQESMTITYKFKLPFALFQVTDKNENAVDSYSLVAQKQSGSIGSQFTKTIELSAGVSAKWSIPGDLMINNRHISLKSNLSVDRFVGLVFEKQKLP